MVPTRAARCRALLPGGFLGLCLCCAGLWLLALPALADAEPPACPEATLEVSEEMPQPEREVRELRNDLRLVCGVLIEQASESLAALQALAAGQKQAHEDSAQLHADLTAEGGLPSKIVGQTAALQVAAPEGGLPVSSPLETAELTAAVQSNSETLDSNLWALAGVAAGFGFLWVLRKLVLS